MPLPDFDAQWNYDDPAGTETAFRKMLAEAGPTADPDWRAELQTQIARTLGLQRKFEEADAVLDGCAGEGGLKAAARWHLERGRVRNSSGRKQEALPLFEEARRLADAAGADYFAVDALHMLAIAAPPEDQLKWHRLAIDRAKNSKEEKARNWRASLLNNLGWTLHDAGNYDEALKTFEEALEARIEQGKEGPIRIARWTVARCLRSLGRVEEALQAQRGLLEDSDGAKDGYVHEEVGECLLALGFAAEAKPHFGNAWALLSPDPWLIANEPDRLDRLKRLSE